MSQEIDAIKSKLNIIDLIGEYVRLQKAGNNWKACCPFHNEKTPSFSVSEDKQVWHCFGCGKGGDAFGFLMEIEGLNFREALENLAQRTGVELPKYQANETLSVQEKNKVWDILELATRFYEKQLWDSNQGKIILNYLTNRGLSYETIRDFRLGYAPDGWRNVVQFLLNKGYLAKEILDTGLIIQKDEVSSAVENYYDRFRNRIMFPIANPTGKIIGYSARIIPGGDESQAKYINTPETDIYHKSSVLYGIDKAKNSIKEKDWILLVEGNMDVAASNQAGIKNTVAISGTALTIEQLNIIKRYTRNIKMFFDMDEAGQKAARRSAQLAFEKEFSVFVVTITEGKDAADAAKNNVNKFIQSIENSISAMEYFIGESFKNRDKNKIEDKKKIIDDLADLINSFTNKVEKEYWIREISNRLNITERILIDEFNKRNYIWSSNIERGPLESPSNNNLKYNKIRDIQIQIMGVFISDDNLWKESVAKYENDVKKYFNNPKVIDIILNKGKLFDFNFERLLANLNDDSQNKFLRELYFKNCEKNDELLSEKERWAVVSQLFEQLRKEINKERSSVLIEEIKEAERNGNKDALIRLSAELMEINKI